MIFLLCPSFTCTRTLMQTQPCCVRVFSHWQQVCEYREDFCARLPPPAPSPLLLDTFVVKRLAAQPDSPLLQQP